MNGVFTVKLVGSDAIGNYYNNILHYKISASPSTSSIATAFDLLDQWQISVMGTYLACLPNDVVLTYLASRQIDSAGHPTAVEALTPSSPGGRPTADAALALGPQISMFAADGGNRVGKLFLPGIAIGDVEDGRMSAGLVGDLDNLRTALAADIMLADGGGAQLCIWSPKTSLPYLVTTLSLAPKLAVLGRRLKPVM